MSKKKNTLKDLDAFLKQQAATLVSPERLTESDAAISPGEDPKTSDNISAEKIISDLNLLSAREQEAFRKKLYDIIIRTLEHQNESLPEDKMLINTALYLASGTDWKETIRQYWHGKK